MSSCKNTQKAGPVHLQLQFAWGWICRSFFSYSIELAGSANENSSSELLPLPGWCLVPPARWKAGKPRHKNRSSSEFCSWWKQGHTNLHTAFMNSNWSPSASWTKRYWVLAGICCKELWHWDEFTVCIPEGHSLHTARTNHWVQQTNHSECSLQHTLLLSTKRYNSEADFH